MTKLSILVLLVSSIIMLNGCTVKDDISLETIQSEIYNSVNLDNMEIGDNKSLKRYFGLNSADFESVVIYTPSYTMNVEEMLLIKVSDEKQIDIVEQAIESRVNKQIETFGSYGPEQCAMLEDYELIIADKYICYVVSKNASEVAKSFKESIY